MTRRLLSRLGAVERAAERALRCAVCAGGVVFRIITGQERVLLPAQKCSACGRELTTVNVLDPYRHGNENPTPLEAAP